MDWVKLIIPLIAVAVWILSNLANQQKEMRRPPRVPKPPPLPREPLDSSTARPEADKYREEMDRKRPAKPNAARPNAARPVPRPRPRRVELDAGARSPVPPIVPIPPTMQGLPQDMARDSQQANGYVVNPILPAISPVIAPTVSANKPTSPAIKGLLDLLQKRDSLATAFLLKEVLDLPVSKRRRRRL